MGDPAEENDPPPESRVLLLQIAGFVNSNLPPQFAAIPG